MQLKLVHFAILYNLLFGEFLPNTTAYNKFYAKNYALVGHQLKRMTSARFRKCVKACKMERACISVNFGGGCCTLNNCGMEDEEDKGKPLVFTPGCWYQQIRPTEAAISKVRLIMVTESYDFSIHVKSNLRFGNSFQ